MVIGVLGVRGDPNPTRIEISRAGVGRQGIRKVEFENLVYGADSIGGFLGGLGAFPGVGLPGAFGGLFLLGCLPNE